MRGHGQPRQSRCALLHVHDVIAGVDNSPIQLRRGHVHRRRSPLVAAGIPWRVGWTRARRSTGRPGPSGARCAGGAWMVVSLPGQSILHHLVVGYVGPRWWLLHRPTGSPTCNHAITWLAPDCKPGQRFLPGQPITMVLENGSHSWAAFGPREVEKQWEMMRDVENSFPLVRGRF